MMYDLNDNLLAADFNKKSICFGFADIDQFRNIFFFPLFYYFEINLTNQQPKKSFFSIETANEGIKK